MDYFFGFQSLLETHDSVASQTCESPPPSPCDFVDHAPEEDKEHTPYPPPDAIRMVGIRKVAGEHLVGCKNIILCFHFICFRGHGCIDEDNSCAGGNGFITDDQ